MFEQGDNWTNDFLSNNASPSCVPPMGARGWTKKILNGPFNGYYFWRNAVDQNTKLVVEKQCDQIYYLSKILFTNFLTKVA